MEEQGIDGLGEEKRHGHENLYKSKRKEYTLRMEALPKVHDLGLDDTDARFNLTTRRNKWVCMLHKGNVRLSLSINDPEFILMSSAPKSFLFLGLTYPCFINYTTKVNWPPHDPRTYGHGNYGVKSQLTSSCLAPKEFRICAPRLFPRRNSPLVYILYLSHKGFAINTL